MTPHCFILHKNELRYTYCCIIYLLFILIGSFIFILLAQNVSAAQVTLAWDPNTEPDLAGYKLYYGTLSRNYSEIIDVGNVNNYKAYKLNSGLTYYFAVTAYDSAGYESDYSNEVNTTIIQQYTLTTNKNGIGSGTIISSPEGINCGTDCTETYNAGTMVTLTATSDSDSNFSVWAGSGCAGNGQCLFNINANTSVTANFTDTTSNSVTVISPNISEVIPSDSIYTIQRRTSPEGVNFDLLFSLDNGLPWKSITLTPVTGTSYNWTVPKPLGNKKTCLVKVINYNTSGKKLSADRSDTPFTIEVVKLTSPGGGETFTSGSTYTITWTTHATKRQVAKVKLFYSKNRGATWNSIDTIKGSNPGSYNWRVPTVGKMRTNCRVRVELKDETGNILGKDASDKYFTIQPSI